jgi:DHA1 family multidrug resistance protein-like MFS transporter
MRLIPRISAPWSTGVWALLTDSFASNFGFFLLMPVLAVYLTRDLHWTAWAAGLLLAIRQFAQQGLAPWGGAWGDRLGYRAAVVIGMEVRAVGFIMFGLVHAGPLIVVAALLSGLGGALFGPADAAALAVAVPEQKRAQVFSQRVVFGNGGMVLGPVIGAYLISVSFAAVSIAAGLMFVLAGIFTAIYYPKEAVAPRQTRGGATRFQEVLKNRPFVSLISTLSGYYLLSSQLNILLPLVVVADHAPTAMIGWLLALYSGCTILLQTTVTRWLSRMLSQTKMVWGLLAATLGMALGALSGWSVLTLFPGVLFLSVGSMLINPAMFAATSELADPQKFGLYYGFSNLSMGIGGSLGNAVGGVLFSLGTAIGFPPLSWLILAGTGVVSTAAMRSLNLPYPVGSAIRASRMA